MTFFYDLNKKLDGIREKPETTHGQLNERATGGYSAKDARAGKDIGKPGKNFEKIAKSAAERYGSKERGEKVAGAVLNKLRHPKEDIEEGMTDDKTAAQQALQALGQGNNQDMIKDLQRRAGVPQTGKVQPGQQPMSEDDMEEGNKFTGNLMKARAAGKKQADLDGDGDMEPVREAAKPDYIDLDKDGNRKESMKKAAADKKKAKQDVSEGTGDAGDTIRQIYQQFYDKGDDALDYLHDRAESFDLYWNRFEGDLDSMIAELPPKILARLARELQGLADQEGITEGWDDMLKAADRMKEAQDNKVSNPKTPKAPEAKVSRHSLLKKVTDPKTGRVLGHVPDAPTDKQETNEAWDDMLKAAEERRREGMKSGEKVQGHKGEIEKTATGIKHTRRYDPKSGETDSDDDEKPAGEKRGRGRPKKTDKAPERVTAKAYKHKGGRKMSKEDIEEAIAALEEAGYSVEERKLTKPEMKKREEVVKSMKKNKGDFEKRYGERGEEVMYATATKMAKKKAEEVEETTVAGSVAPSAAAPKSKGKGGMTFGKGIYDSMNRELETMIAESMNVSVNMSQDEHGQPRKSISISAEGEAAEQLAQLLNLAGMSAPSHEETCPVCGSTDCGCEELDENQPDWPTNTEYTSMKQSTDPVSNDLNKNKDTGQTVGAPFNRQPQRQGVMDEAAPAGLQRAGDIAGQVVGAGLAGALAAIPGIVIGGATLGPGGAIGAGGALGLAGAKAGVNLGGQAGRTATNAAYDSVVNLWRKASAKLGGPEATAEFVKAHAQAADYGQPSFEFGGKKYQVTMDRAQARKAMNDLAKMTAGSTVSEESVKVEESVDELTKLWKTYKG